MADASRFPNLALPFAITGAAGGWLSAGLVQHPLFRDMSTPFRAVTAGTAAAFGLLSGMVLRRWCVGRRYAFQLDAPDPGHRPSSDSWARHLPLLTSAGTAAGALSCEWTGMAPAWLGAVGGLLCTLPFLPICAAVLSTARRAQRARLGSIVAGADRRAVWTILAATLLIATLEALPDWAVPITGPLQGPLSGVALFAAAAVCIAVVLVLDSLALRRAQGLVGTAMAPREADDPGLDRDGAERADLGLGRDLHARTAPGGTAYRSRERTVALVLGDPARALAALRRAVRRDVLALAIAPFVLAAHCFAGSEMVVARYQEMVCRRGHGASCAALAERSHSGGRSDVFDAVLHYERGCDRGDGWSCLSVARLYSGTQEAKRDAAMVALFEYRAAQRGLCPAGQVLIGQYTALSGDEKVCVSPSDPRAPRVASLSGR